MKTLTLFGALAFATVGGISMSGCSDSDGGGGGGGGGGISGEAQRVCSHVLQCYSSIIPDDLLTEETYCAAYNYYVNAPGIGARCSNAISSYFDCLANQSCEDLLEGETSCDDESDAIDACAGE